MGLRETLQAVTSTAIGAVGNIAETVTYKSFNSTAYTVSTGGAEAVYTLYESIKAVSANFTAREIDGENILPADKKFLIANSDLVPVPKADDIVTDGSGLGDSWDVISVVTDPVEALYILQVRRVSTDDG